VPGLVLAYCAFLFIENQIGPDFRECVSYGAAQYKTMNGYLPLSRAFKIENICSLSLIDRHNGFFALFGTLAVASFTFTLWQSTEKLWIAGEGTAKRELSRLRKFVFRLG
jgi:hypothetical protein